MTWKLAEIFAKYSIVNIFNKEKSWTNCQHEVCSHFIIHLINYISYVFIRYFWNDAKINLFFVGLIEIIFIFWKNIEKDKSRWEIKVTRFASKFTAGTFFNYYTWFHPPCEFSGKLKKKCTHIHVVKQSAGGIKPKKIIEKLLAMYEM